jgi:hypothetical protein
MEPPAENAGDDASSDGPEGNDAWCPSAQGSACEPIPEGGLGCVELGAIFDGKNQPVQSCCAGLTAIDFHDSIATCDGGCAPEPSHPQCSSVLFPGTKVCTMCGDGTCGVGENSCNCPSDCPAVDAGSFDDAGG